MKNNYKSISCIILFACVTVHLLRSQNNLYTPLEFEQAYKNGTRAYSGKPGKKYWQNSANYDIEAELVPEESQLRGKETITYFNNSPDTLHTIVFQLFQDMYKKGNPRKRHIIPSDVTEGTNILLLEINSKPINLNDANKASRQNGLLKVELSNPILPGKSANFSVEWDFHIPEKTYIRTARFDSTSFFVAYWFPRIAVYDDIFGWDNHGYDGLHEFNNDYGNFNVRIKLPDDYFIWSSGELKNANTVYSKEVLKKLSESKDFGRPVRLITGNSLPHNKGKGVKEWIFSAKNTKDFAFGLSNHHNWDAINFKIEDGSEVQVNVVYIPESERYFKIMPEFLKECIRYFSDELPGVNYPYAEYTAFQGLKKGWHTAIEFPALSNYSYHLEDTINFSVFAHELAHNYFPFYVNINETEFLWLEEGLTVYFEYAIMRNLLEMEKFDVYEKKHPLDMYSGGYYDVPPFIASTLYEREMVLQTAYFRPAYAYIILEDLLGKEVFRNCMKEFITRWEGKRPIPHDMFNAFNNISGQNLNWFWKPWFFEFGYPDLSIDNVKKNIITIKRIGILPIPVHVAITYKDGSYEEIYKTAKIWKNGNEFFEIRANANKELNTIILSDRTEIPDVNRTNNVYNAEN